MLLSVFQFRFYKNIFDPQSFDVRSPFCCLRKFVTRPPIVFAIRLFDVRLFAVGFGRSVTASLKGASMQDFTFHLSLPARLFGLILDPMFVDFFDQPICPQTYQRPLSVTGLL